MRWTRSTLAVAEAALSGITPTVESIEQATGLSRHATATALSRLEDLGFLERSRALRGPQSARRITNVSAFLDAYAEAAAEQRKKQSPTLVHRLWDGDPLETLALGIGPALTRANARWAVTGAAASVLLAPYLTDVTTLELYIDAETMSDRANLSSLLGGRIVEKGHRIEVRGVPTSMAVKGPVMDGMQIALPVRVYADLRAVGGRWAEAGQHLRETFDVGTAA
jgi:DNA-binding MarR family transcriptional regulator